METLQQITLTLFFFLINLFIFGCVGSSFLCKGFLWLRQAGAALHRGIAASLVAEHRLQTRRLSNCGSRAQLLRSMWDLPRPGLKPVSSALAGGFLTTAPSGKPNSHSLCTFFSVCFISTLVFSIPSPLKLSIVASF